MICDFTERDGILLEHREAFETSLWKTLIPHTRKYVSPELFLPSIIVNEKQKEPMHHHPLPPKRRAIPPFCIYVGSGIHK
jgi:hypothetical protein